MTRKINKKGGELLQGELVFIILSLAFFVALFLFVAKAGTGVSLYEQAYSKKIGLLIDQAKPGTIVYLDISPMLEFAKKNKINPSKIVSVNNEENTVRVVLARGEGISYNFFNDLDVLWAVNPETKKLELEFRR